LGGNGRQIACIRTAKARFENDFATRAAMRECRRGVLIDLGSVSGRNPARLSNMQAIAFRAESPEAGAYAIID
jgi:hypothetical protein